MGHTTARHGRRFLTALALLAIPSLTARAQERARTEYRFDARSESGYESNPRYIVGGDGAFSTRATLGGEARRESERTSVSALARGGAVRYDRFQDLDRYEYVAGVDVTHRVTGRLQLQASGRTSRSLSRVATIGTTGLALFPLALTRSTQAAAAMGYRVDPRTTVDVGAEHERVDFTGSALQGGELLGAHASLGRRYSETTDLELRYRYDRNSLSGGTVGTQSLAGGWQRVFSRGAAHATLGGARLDASGPRGARWRAIGDAAIVRRVGGSGAATLHYAHSVSQVYGLGEVLESDVVGGGYGITTRRGFHAVAEVFRGWFAQPGITAGSRIESNGSTVLLGQPIGRRFGVEAQLFARRTNTAMATIPSRGALVSLAYRY